MISSLPRTSLNASGAEAVVAVLQALGVERVFGLPGIQNMELFDALAEAPFPCVTATSESSAAFMADAHARVTGRLGVLVITAGPGLTNAITGIAEARLDSSPLLVLLGAANTSTGKSFPLHQIPQCDLLRPLVKGFWQPQVASEIPTALFEAAAMAQRSEPGPVVVEISAELLMTRMRFSLTGPDDCPLPPCDPALLADAAQRLRCSPSVGIYAGAGAMESGTELQALAELLEAPVATTISGRGVIPEDHPLSVGYGFRRSGTAAAWRAFRGISTLLSIGCKFGEVATGSYGVRPPSVHVHIDINPDSLGRNYPASLTIVADAKVALAGLLHQLRDARRPVNAPLREKIRLAKTRRECETTTAPPNAEAVDPARFMQMLRRHLERDAILVTDCGAHQFWALSDFAVLASRSFLTPTDFQAMGFSIPAGISAKLASTRQRVVSLVGDGGFLMSGFECLTASRLGVPLLVVLFRDGAWGLIRDAQQRVYRRTPFTEIPNPNYAQLAESFGWKYVGVDNDEQIECGLRDALAARAPCLLDVNVCYDRSPPYVRGAAKQMFRNLPSRLQAQVGMRFLKRLLLQSVRGQT